MLRQEKTTPRILDESVLRSRARAVRLLLTDCDGVLTDGGVYYSERGEAMMRFSVRDGMGVERLRRNGIATALVTRSVSGSIRRRAQKLNLSAVYEGILDKDRALRLLLSGHNCTMREVACIGDDLNDLNLLLKVGVEGLTGAPSDAMDEVLGAVHFRSKRPGGHGAFREFAEWILELRRGPDADEVRFSRSH